LASDLLTSDIYSRVIALFDNDADEALEYLEERDLDVARAMLLERLGRNVEAAEVHLMAGRTLDGITLLLKNPGDEDAMRKGNKSILQGLWKHISFGVSPDKTNPMMKQLLCLASKVDAAVLDNKDRDEVCFFRTTANL
jgi:hypothetical protein